MERVKTTGLICSILGEKTLYHDGYTKRCPKKGLPKDNTGPLILNGLYVQKICLKMFRFLDKWRYDRILYVLCINPNSPLRPISMDVSRSAFPIFILKPAFPKRASYCGSMGSNCARSWTMWSWRSIGAAMLGASITLK